MVGLVSLITSTGAENFGCVLVPVFRLRQPSVAFSKDEIKEPIPVEICCSNCADPSEIERLGLLPPSLDPVSHQRPRLGRHPDLEKRIKSQGIIRFPRLSAVEVDGNLPAALGHEEVGNPSPLKSTTQGLSCSIPMP